MAFARLPTGVRVIGVNSGYALSFIKDVAEKLQWAASPAAGSQFRSRDVFPQAAAAIALGLPTPLGMRSTCIRYRHRLPRRSPTWTVMEISKPPLGMIARRSNRGRGSACGSMITSMKRRSATAPLPFSTANWLLPQGVDGDLPPWWQCVGSLQKTGNRRRRIHCVCLILRTPDGRTGTGQLVEVSLAIEDYPGSPRRVDPRDVDGVRISEEETGEAHTFLGATCLYSLG